VFVYELTGGEANPLYQALAIDNLDRQYGFMRSIVVASLGLGRPLLSVEVIRALNYHAISCLHINAGEFRPCAVTVGAYTPPPHYQVPALMSMFVDQVNRSWETADPVSLAAFVLWRLNHIHPFINGNGRTARACCYFALCLKLGGWLPGKTTLPELIQANRPEYVTLLQAADASLIAGALDLSGLHGFLVKLLQEQLADVEAVPPEA
jgi:Fic family protein